MEVKKDLKAFISVDDDVVFQEYDSKEVIEALRQARNNKKYREKNNEKKKITDKLGEKIMVFQNTLMSMAVNLVGAEKDTLLVLMALCEYENEIHATQKELAKILNKHVPSISTAIKSLERKGYIEIIRRHNVNTYRVLPNKAWKGTFDNHKIAINEMGE